MAALGVEFDAQIISWLDRREDEPERAIVRYAVKSSLDAIAAVAPGRSVEVRVPPFGAVQCIDGPTHTRGRPPTVVEAGYRAWLELVTGRLNWDDALRVGVLRASGARTEELRKLLGPG